MILALLRTPAVRYALAGIGIVLLIAFVILRLTAAEKADDESNQKIGATLEREAAQAEVIKQVEQGNAARDEITSDVGSARYDQCLRTARTPANCERLLPERQADQR